MKLHEFIAQHRAEIIERARAKVALRPAPRATEDELSSGVPLFLTQLGDILRRETLHSPSDGVAMGASATQHGRDLLKHGFSISQVVHDYGDICQAITELALETNVAVGTEDFHTLNRCLDEAIASAVTEYSRQRQVDISDAEVQRYGFFAHELRNHLNTATLAFHLVKSGRVGTTGSTVEVMERSLRGLRHLIDRSLSEVRLESGTHRRERLLVSEFVDEMEVDASFEAEDRGLQLSVARVDHPLTIDVDRHLFASAISNLLQNAFKFSRPGGHVKVRTHSAGERVLIEIEDECGGLPAGTAEMMFRPFDQHGVHHEGLGLGLAISRQAVESDGGKISVRDLPGRGCVFTVDMPLAAGELVAV